MGESISKIIFSQLLLRRRTMSDTFEVTGPMAILMARIDESPNILPLDSFTEAAQEAIQKMAKEGLIMGLWSDSNHIALTDKGFDTMSEHDAYGELLHQRSVDKK